MKTTPFREWRLLHRIKVAERRGDYEQVNQLIHELGKLRIRNAERKN